MLWSILSLIVVSLLCGTARNGKVGRSSGRSLSRRQKALCKAMFDDHPGVICYHVDYPV